MASTSSNERSPLPLKILAFLSLIPLTLTGCMKEIKETDGDLGKEATESEYQKIVNDALDGVSLLNAKVGYSVTYENNQRVELGPVIKTEEFTHKLIQIKTHESESKFILFRDAYAFDPVHGGITSEVHAELPPVLFRFGPSLKAQAQDCDGELVDSPNGKPYDCIKIYNLKSSELFAAAPEAIQNKPNCMGLANCQLKIQKITYDEVKWRDGKSVETINVSYEIAKDVPDLIYIANSDGRITGYMPPVLSACQRGHFEWNGTDHIVQLCTVLKDFNNTVKP